MGGADYTYSFNVEVSGDVIKVVRRTTLYVGGQARDFIDEYRIEKVSYPVGGSECWERPCGTRYVVVANGRAQSFTSLTEAVNYLLSAVAEPPDVTKLIAGLSRLGNVSADLDKT